MDGIISAPICIAGFFILPDLPDNTRAFYLSGSVRLLVLRNIYARLTSIRIVS
jgi:ACS family pantothenate transporter-like MFS transporter